MNKNDFTICCSTPSQCNFHIAIGHHNSYKQIQLLLTGLQIQHRYFQFCVGRSGLCVGIYILIFHMGSFYLTRNICRPLQISLYAFFCVSLISILTEKSFCILHTETQLLHYEHFPCGFLVQTFFHKRTHKKSIQCYSFLQEFLNYFFSISFSQTLLCAS